MISSCFEEVKGSLPTALWTLQAINEFLVDFHTGIVKYVLVTIVFLPNTVDMVFKKQPLND